MELNALNIPQLDLADNPQDIREHFTRVGAVIIRDVLDVSLLDRLKSGIRELIYRQLKHTSADVELHKNNTGLDQLFNTLCAMDRRRGGYVYNAIQWLPEYLEVLSTSELVRSSKILLNTSHVISPPILSWLRIDRQSELRNYFPWHQDYTYNLASRPTVTAWAPLFEISDAMGPLTIVPGSHHYHYPVAVNESDRYASLTEISTEDLEKKAVTVAPRVGDALFFHELLLHRSGANRSELARWVLNARWASLDDTEFSERGWQFRRETSFQLLKSLHHDKFRTMAEGSAVTE